MPSRTLTLRLNESQAEALECMQSEIGETVATKAIAKAVAAYSRRPEELALARERIEELEQVIRDYDDCYMAEVTARDQREEAAQRLHKMATGLGRHRYFAIGSRRRRSSPALDSVSG